MSVRSLVAALALTVLLAGSASGGILLDNPTAAWYDPAIGLYWTGSTLMSNTACLAPPSNGPSSGPATTPAAATRLPPMNSSTPTRFSARVWTLSRG